MRQGAGQWGRWGPDLSILGMLPDLRRHNCGCTGRYNAGHKSSLRPPSSRSPCLQLEDGQWLQQFIFLQKGHSSISNPFCSSKSLPHPTKKQHLFPFPLIDLNPFAYHRIKVLNAPTSYLRTSGFTYLLTHLLLHIMTPFLQPGLFHVSQTYLVLSCLCLFSYHSLSLTTFGKPI